MNYLVFDIGGTNFRVAFFRDKKLIKEKRFPTVNGNGLLKQLIGCVVYFRDEYKIKMFDGIGISAPGFLESDKLMLTAPVNLNKIKNLSLKSLKKFTKKLVLENDGNCAGFGAFVLEKRKVNNLACLTLGTGLGSGLILGGKLYVGKGVGSEFGHTIINFNGEKCSCGNKGCFENYVSIRGLNNLIKKYDLNVNSFGLRELALNGNKKAFSVYKEFGYFLGIGLANLANTIDVEVIYLTGGLTNSSRFFIGGAVKEARKNFFKGINPRIKVNSKNLSLMGALELVK